MTSALGGFCWKPYPALDVYNDGQTGAPNHRFTADLGTYQQFTTTMGWLLEGIVFCAP